MKNLTIISILIISSMLNSCIKEDEDEKFITFTGQILEFCDGAPLANTDLAIWQPEEAFFGNGGLLTYSAKTDANGNFSFVVEDGRAIKIRVGSRAIINRIPAKKSLDFGTFFANPTTSFVYRIKVNNPYQVGDTLYITSFIGAPYKIPAPLHDSIFPPRMNYSPLAPQTYPLDGTISIVGGYTVFRGLDNTADNILIDKPFEFNLPVCNKIDTITIEIN